MNSIVSMPEREQVPKNWGFSPSGHRIVVLPILVKRMSPGGIAIPDQLAEREDMAQVEAEVMEVGPTCWKDQPSEPWCRPGDLVLIAKYGGLVRKGPDGRSYRVINDLDIVGVCHAS